MPYTSDRRIYLDADGNVVEESDPKAAELLVHEGGVIPNRVARKYGLLDDPADANEGTAAEAPTRSKARRRAEDKAVAPGEDKAEEPANDKADEQPDEPAADVPAEPQAE